MKIRHNDIEINESDPFLNCKLERKQYAFVLTDIIKNFNEGFVLAIDNKWGTGKTTFVKMWKQHLNNNDYKTLYFNAWENDFEQDILVTLISELKELKTSKNEESFKKVINKAVPLAKSLALGVLKTQVEKHVGNEFVKEFINQTSSNVADGLQEQIEIYTRKKNSILEFKDSLNKFVSQTTESKPVVFIIDELDRCRPNYAVELLEQIKHLFSVPGIVFVLSIDKIQLGNAVRGVYGSDLIDANEYLRRFIDIEYSIPEPDTKLFCNYLYDYFQFDKFFSNEERLRYNVFQYDKSSFVDFIIALFHYGQLPLRVQEKIFAHARLALLLFVPNHYLIPSLFVLLMYLKIKHTEIYNSIKNSKYTLQGLIDDVEDVLPLNIQDKDLRKFIYTMVWLVQTYNNAKEYHLRENLIIKGEGDKEDKLAIKLKIDKSENNQELFKAVDYFRKSYNEMHEVGINHLIKKIELTEMIQMN
ncbi:MAG: hypothetical protein JXA68_07175 [Ignavibacteriales bacterium]|nr:hypothetical protein [Ignavibacteriales bacterium]